MDMSNSEDRIGLAGLVLTLAGGVSMFSMTTFFPAVLCGAVAVAGMGLVCWWATS